MEYMVGTVGTVGAAQTTDRWVPTDGKRYETIRDAIAAVKESEHAKWKWATPSGNCKTTAYLVCSAHVDCGRRARVSSEGNQFKIMISGKHTTQPTKGRRSNSALTWEQEATMRAAVNEGRTPAVVRSSMLDNAAKRLRDEGEDPLLHKLPEGGLPGASQACGDPIQIPS